MAPIAAACIGFAAYLSRFAGGASARRHTRRPLAHPHPAGGHDYPRPARHHDGGDPTDGDIFLADREQVLCPQRSPGQVVVMDHLGAHKVAGVQERIEATGVELLYLPPYSPHFKPIEQSWSKTKQLIRSA